MLTQKPPPDPPLFTPQQRGIFDYSDGVSRKWADPMTINRKIRQVDPDIDGSIREYNRLFFDEHGKPLYQMTDGKITGPLLKPETEPNAAVVKLAADAEERIIRAARHAFGMPSINPETGAGVPDQVVLAAMWRFIEFQEKNGSRAGN